VLIGADNKTLAGIKNAINNASDNKGITASIITLNDASSKLILTSDGFGLKNKINIVVDDDDGNDTNTGELSRLSLTKDNLKEVDPAKDAEFTIDDDKITRSTNTIDDVLDGVTFTLVKADADPVTVSMSQTHAAATTKIKKVVGAYNKLVSAIESMRTQGYSGSSLLRNIENNIRDLFTNTPNSITGEVNTAIEAGFSFDKDGLLKLDTDSLDDAVSDNFNSLVTFFTAKKDGFSDRLETLMGQYIDSDGVIATTVKNLKLEASSYDDKIGQLNARLLVVEKRYRSQFVNLDILMTQFNATSSYLTKQLDQLSNLNTQISRR
jgi:flagellar hook-associated protein 2